MRDLVRHAPEMKPVDDLLLDSTNPRLADEEESQDQNTLTQVLWKEMAVDEVALSIARNGYFPEEPLIVIPTPRRPGKFTVVEGNRRLVAVRVLRDATLRAALGADLPTLTAAERRRLDQVPASTYQDRQEMWEYLGFRHVNGPQPWNAFAKATYVARVHEEYKVPLDDIAKSIGDRHSTVVRLYRGLKVLQQAERLGFDREDRTKQRFAFSHLYTALDQSQFQDYIGITSANSLKANPVPKANRESLMHLMTWLYGSETQNLPSLIRSQNPDLNTLRDLISSKAGRRALEEGFTLEKAAEATTTPDRRFRGALTRAKADLESASATVATGFDGEDLELLETGKENALTAESIWEEMQRIGSKRQKRKREAT